MRSMKKLGVLVAVLALSAIGAANASAATFTATTGGVALTGKALENQVFTTNGGIISCSNAATTGTVNGTAATEQHVTVKYSGCTAFGFASVDISDATYEFWAYTMELITVEGKWKSVPARNFRIENTISVTPTFFGSSMCTVTIGPQWVRTVDYSNAGTSNVKVNPTVEGIQYTSTGGSCGSSGTNGTYRGANEFSSKENTLRYD